MSAGGFDVDLDVLNAHAGRLGAVTDAVGQAGDAANQVDLNDGAFGLMCAMLPGVVNRAEQGTGEAMSDGVRAMARDYASVDDTVRSRMESLGAR